LLFAALLFQWSTAHPGNGAVKEAVGALLVGGLGIYFGLEGRKLMKARARLHKHGLVFDDVTGQRTVEWEEVQWVEAQYVPGVLKKGTADEGNLVALIVLAGDARFVLPKELSEFGKLKESLLKLCKAPLRQVVVASLLDRG
jgi:hypothetical protein